MNCRWATMKEQQNNRRNNRRIGWCGKTHTLAEWCKIIKLNYSAVYLRLYRLGWTVERAFTTPILDSKFR